MKLYIKNIFFKSKSKILKKFAKKHSIKFVDLKLKKVKPEDFTGFPKVTAADFKDIPNLNP